MDTFEKIRALLAEQLDVDPAKITLESDIMSDFEADSLDIADDDDYFSTLPERVKQELSQYRTEVSDSSELRRLAEKIMLRY